MENLDIKKLFFKGIAAANENIIETIPFSEGNEDIHKKGVLNILKAIENNYVIDNNNKNILSLLFYYFTGNAEKCKENNISLTKGILLCGGVGVGKSLIFKGYKEYTGKILSRNSFLWFQASEIIDNVNVSGVSFLEQFNDNYQCFKAFPKVMYVDDICSKNEKIKNYGTEINVIEQLISIRYNVFQRYRKLTHFSTNIYPSEMTSYYDIRIIDRLVEMCNIVELHGEESRRK